MKIIIVGLGKVGRTLAVDLCQEGHDITVIDTDGEKVQQLSDSYDLMGVHGNGASHAVQLEAGIEDTDLLIAVTGSDELNLFCCLIAKGAAKCNAIARVRNPEYNTENDFIREKLGLTAIINPELASARDIARSLRFPSAIEVESFARSHVEILKFRVPENSILDGMRISDIHRKVHEDVLICVVERGEDVIIPSGDTILREKDIISVVTDFHEANKFFEEVGIEENPVKNVMIVGGSSLAFYLTRMLEANGMHVKIIEQNMERCEMLNEMLPKTTIVHGDASDKELLVEEGLTEYDAFAALTNVDEENILVSLYAKKLGGHKKIYTKIDRIAFDEVIRELELDSIVHPKDITADLISRFVRTSGDSQARGDNGIVTLHRFANGKAEALEFLIGEATQKVVGCPLQDLSIRKEVLIACIYRKGKVIIPRGSDRLQVGDSVIVVAKEKRLKQVDDILA